jgi:hypothetical protein
MSKQRSIETDIFGLVIRPDKINSKSKGDNNERECCIPLGEWTGEPFCRVPSSGGRRWKDTANVCGDVVCETSSFDFCFTIETKHYKKMAMPRKLRSNSTVFKHWFQCKADAERANREVMLLLRQNGMPKQEYLLYVTKIIGDILIANYGLKIKSEGQYKKDGFDFSISGFSSSEFFTLVPYEKLYSMVKT